MECEQVPPDALEDRESSCRRLFVDDYPLRQAYQLMDVRLEKSFPRFMFSNSGPKDSQLLF